MILECCTTPIVAVVVGRIVVVAVARWFVAAIVVVVATTIDPVVGRVGLMIYPYSLETMSLSLRFYSNFI